MQTQCLIQSPAPAVDSCSPIPPVARSADLQPVTQFGIANLPFLLPYQPLHPPLAFIFAVAPFSISLSRVSFLSRCPPILVPTSPFQGAHHAQR